VIYVINIIQLLIYICGAFIIYSILYGYFSSHDIYPYKKAPLFYSIILSVFIVPALVVLYQIIEIYDYDTFVIKIFPDFKTNKIILQYYDIEHVDNIWYCTSDSKFGPSISTFLYNNLENIYKK